MDLLSFPVTQEAMGQHCAMLRRTNSIHFQIAKWKVDKEVLKNMKRFLKMCNILYR